MITVMIVPSNIINEKYVIIMNSLRRWVPIIRISILHINRFASIQQIYQFIDRILVYLTCMFLISRRFLTHCISNRFQKMSFDYQNITPYIHLFDWKYV